MSATYHARFSRSHEQQLDMKPKHPAFRLRAAQPFTVMSREDLSEKLHKGWRYVACESQYRRCTELIRDSDGIRCQWYGDTLEKTKNHFAARCNECIETGAK